MRRRIQCLAITLALLVGLTLPVLAAEALTVTARYHLLPSEKRITLWAAAYDETGRMVDAAAYTGAVDNSGAVDTGALYLDTTAGADFVRVFLWDAATGAPLGEAVEHSLK